MYILSSHYNELEFCSQFTSEMYNEDSVAQNMMKLGLEEQTQPPKKTRAKRRQRTAQSNTEYQKGQLITC